jgi:hypothetical protein
MRFTRILFATGLLALVIAPIAAALAFTDESFNVPQGTVGTPYSHVFEIRAGGGCPPYEYRILSGSLPPGITLTPDGKSGGTVSGTPTAGGDYSFWLDGSDTPAACGFPATPPAHTQREFTIRILQGLNIKQNSLSPTATFANAPYSFQLSSDATVSTTWSIISGALPAGITLNASSGLISGTPTVTGDFTFKVQVSDGSRTDSETYNLTVVEPLKLANIHASAEVGLPFALGPTATGGRAGYTWSLEGTLPAGLVFDPATGALSGKPQAPGSYPLKLTVRDALALSTTVDVPLVVSPRLLVTKAPLKTATVGKLYRGRFLSTGGVLPRRWKILGGLPGFLPPGIKLDHKTGRLTGTPTKPGVYRLRMQVVDKLGAKSAAGFILKVVA